MSFRYEYELGRASDLLARELLRLGDDETIVITADTKSDPRVVHATARSAFAVGAKPMVVWLPAPLGVGGLADPMLPIDALVGALRGADAWVEFNHQWLLYSTPHARAMRENPRLRYLCLVGMNVDMMVRCIGRVDHRALQRFLAAAVEKIRAANEIRMTSPAGTDVHFRNIEGHGALIRDGYADRPGTHMMGGFIAWTPDLDSIHGTIVFDGSLVPPCGLLSEPVRLRIEGGAIAGVSGGRQARQFDAYLERLAHPQMRRLAHASFGFHPGARLTGNIVEDERVWGCTEWGIGQIGAQLLPPRRIPTVSPSTAPSGSMAARSPTAVRSSIRSWRISPVPSGADAGRALRAAGGGDRPGAARGSSPRSSARPRGAPERSSAPKGGATRR